MGPKVIFLKKTPIAHGMILVIKSNCKMGQTFCKESPEVQEAIVSYKKLY